MLRILFFAIFLAFLGQVTGVTAALAVDRCAESCPDDDAEDRCPPSCTHCACGLQLAVEVPAASFVKLRAPPVAAPGDAPSTGPTLAPPMPDPREISHIPR